MYVVGLTGGIGSGKTAVSDHLEHKGIVVVDADRVSREVVAAGSDALPKIAAHFGEAFILADGQLDRSRLRHRIFSDNDAKHWLEGLLHPLIRQESYRQLQAADSPYVLLVSPLLIEFGQTAICDQVLVVDIAETTQIARTMSRDDNSEQQVRNIIASQTSRAQRLEAATEIIDNSGNLPALMTRIDAVHLKLLALAKQTQGETNR
jgi:dephospho-CoA kinase